MKIQISEKQYDLLLGHTNKPKQIEEQPTDPSASQPTAGTSSSGSKQGYPEVGKWESGVTRGPGNQVGVTKWSDVVGSTLKRGKSNQLK
jgi:hypothetical protein